MPFQGSVGPVEKLEFSLVFPSLPCQSIPSLPEKKRLLWGLVRPVDLDNSELLRECLDLLR